MACCRENVSRQGHRIDNPYGGNELSATGHWWSVGGGFCGVYIFQIRLAAGLESGCFSCVSFSALRCFCVRTSALWSNPHVSKTIISAFLTDSDSFSFPACGRPSWEGCVARNLADYDDRRRPMGHGFARNHWLRSRHVSATGPCGLLMLACLGGSAWNLHRAKSAPTPEGLLYQPPKFLA